MKSENKNELISIMVNICTRVIALIFIVSTLFQRFILHQDAHWAINDIWGVVFIGIVSGLGAGFFCGQRDMSKVKATVIQIAYFLILNAVLLFTGLYLGWFDKELSSLIVMEIMFLIIYIAVSVLVYLLDYNEAKKINQKIQDRKKIQGNDDTQSQN